MKLGDLWKVVKVKIEAGKLVVVDFRDVVVE